MHSPLSPTEGYRLRMYSCTAVHDKQSTRGVLVSLWVHVLNLVPQLLAAVARCTSSTCTLILEFRQKHASGGLDKYCTYNTGTYRVRFFRVCAAAQSGRHRPIRLSWKRRRARPTTTFVAGHLQFLHLFEGPVPTVANKTIVETTANWVARAKTAHANGSCINPTGTPSAPAHPAPAINQCPYWSARRRHLPCSGNHRRAVAPAERPRPSDHRWAATAAVPLGWAAPLGPAAHQSGLGAPAGRAVRAWRAPAGILGGRRGARTAAAGT